MVESMNKIIDLRSDTVTLPNKEMRQSIFDARVGDDVLEEDPTIQKLEQYASKLLGKEAGDTFSVTVEPEQGYGERHDDLMQAVPKSMFEGMEIEVGMQFRATTDAGDQSVMIIEIQDEDVIVDGNHPLSGITLHFDVEVLEVRDATEEELAHGHVHGEGGCGHSH